MKRSGTLVTAFAVASLAALLAPAMASAEVIAVHLIGYNETPVTINSAGTASFVVRINEDGTSIEYELSYGGLSSTVLQSHIHFGEPAISGPVVLFLCTNLGNAPATVPAPQACPTQPATITGTLTAANVIANTAGIDSGAAGFAEMVKAIRAGAAYVNLHTTSHPSGEVRARLKSGD
jgi:CHRD domain